MNSRLQQSPGDDATTWVDGAPESPEPLATQSAGASIEGKARAHGGAVGSRLDAKLSAHQRDALLHPEQPLAGDAPARSGDVETIAVVANRQDQSVLAGAAQLDFHAARMS